MLLQTFSMVGSAAVTGGLVLVALTVFTTWLTHTHVPQPYMDEIFHVDQVQQYCVGNWTYWNSKLSTPPGLYLLTVPLVHTSAWLIGHDVACSLTALRTYTLLWTPSLQLLVFSLVYRMRSASQPDSPVQTAAEACVLLLMPVLHFTTLLYYTDMLSLLCVLFSYGLQQRGCLRLSASLGAMSILCRQPNLIWLCFCAALALCTFVRTQLTAHTKRHDVRFTDDGSVCGLCTAVMQLPFVPLCLMALRAALHIWPYLLVLVSAAMLFVANDFSLSFGDHSAHVPVPHAAQLVYCIGALSVFGWPHLLQPSVLQHGVHTVRTYRALFVLMLCTAVLCVHFGVYEHEYLLADNRHYTFYVWRRVLMAHWGVKYVAALVAVPLLLLLNSTLRHMSQIWRLGLFLATALVVVPNRLLEFRYFIAPYIMWRLHVVRTRAAVVALELCTFVSVNVITVYLFLYKPFEWPHEPGVQQRFMW